MSNHGKLTEQNVKNWQGMLRTDATERGRAVNDLRNNLSHFVESTFDLTPEERKQMHRLLRKPVADALGNALSAALENDGEIEYKHSALPPGEKHATLVFKTSVTTNWYIHVYLGVGS